MPTLNKAALLLMLAIFMVNTAQAATISVDPSSSVVGNGDIFFIDIIGETFPTTEGGGFNLSFDPFVINILSVSIDGGVWNFVNDLGTIDNLAGTLSEVLVSAFPGVATVDFVVATLETKAVGLGTSALSLTESVTNPWASGGPLIAPGFTPGSVTVISSVPLPATFWLLVSGLAGLFRFTR